MTKIKQVNKFIVNLTPKVALIPSISEEVGPVIDHTLIRSPAPNILVRILAFRDNNITLVYKFISLGDITRR